MDLPAVPSALLDALKAAATEAGVPRLALVGGVVRDLLLHQRHGRPWTGVPDLDWVVEGSAAHLADVLLERCGTERVSGVQHHGQFGTVALNLEECPSIWPRRGRSTIRGRHRTPWCSRDRWRRIWCGVISRSMPWLWT